MTGLWQRKPGNKPKAYRVTPAEGKPYTLRHDEVIELTVYFVKPSEPSGQ